jgi:pyruvate kinase
VRRQLAVVYGVRARAAPWYGTPGADVMERLRACVRAEGDIPAGARIVVLAGLPYEQPGVTNLIHVACV